MLARKALNSHAISEETRKWSNVIKESDSKSFWTYVNWKVNVGKKRNTTAPTLNEFEIFFQELYKCNNNAELLEIMNIQSDVNIPILDSSISEDKIKVAFKTMKKSGYDNSIPVLKALVASFSLLLATIFNIMFFC